jgi:nucleoside recognition membrane protein YjiH
VTPRSLLRFLLPSTLVCLLFLVPIIHVGKTGIGLGFLLEWLRLPFRGYELPLIVSIVTCSAVGSAYFLIRKPLCRDSHPTLYGMFQVSPHWFFLRAASACLGIMVYLGVGPAVLLAGDTGPLLLLLIGSAVLAFHTPVPLYNRL